MAAAALAGAGRRPGAPASAPADGDGDSGVGPDLTKTAGPVIKYQPATPQQIEAFRGKAEAWAEQTRKTIVKTMHLVETEHFLIYSAWARSNDKALKNICERMYRAMCKQFDIPRSVNIWAGKCPIYVFWQAEHFARFCTEVDRRGNPKAGGYCAYSGRGYVYIVVNRCRSRTRFYEVLVHEATHGFLARYKTNRHVPTWANEGLAEYMAATLVPGAWAGRKYVDATKAAVRGGQDVAHIFKGVRLNAFDYGVAQSLVRYLIKRDRKAFIKFIDVIKEGKTDEQALKSAFALSHQELLDAWAKEASRKLRRR